jgi:membrane-bound lytic murein transglycosylase D
MTRVAANACHRRRDLRAVVAALVLALPCAANTEEDREEWMDLLDQGIRLFQDYGIQDLEWPADADWQSFWADVESALHAGSVEDLAWILPEVEAAEEILGRFEETRPLAHWLASRRDYFEMASETVRGQGAPQRPKAPPPKTIPGPKAIVPPKRPAAAPKAAPSKAIRDVEIWKRKIAGRKPPASAARMIPTIKKVFREEGIPPELAWLAEVESTLDPSARSPAGAVGLFQLMPATAQRFGLRLRPRDERLQPEKNGRAAAQYLRLLKGQFASWPLALAAYNAGEGRVQRAMAKSGGATFDAVAPHLPVETQMYVPKTLATVDLREGVDLRARLPRGAPPVPAAAQRALVRR